MSNDHLKLEPHQVEDGQWWYETPEGIIVLAELYHDGRFIGTTEVKIPWRKIRAAVVRKDKP